MENRTPKVTLMTWTQNPIQTVYALWQASKNEEPLVDPLVMEYPDGEDVRVDYTELLELFKAVIAQRIPIGEHIDFVFMIENISVSWREQAVRHRIGVEISPERLGIDIIPNLAKSTWWSQSMRIQNMGRFASNRAYRLPETLAGKLVDGGVGAECLFHETMLAIEKAYDQLVAAGVPMEDARELMPLGAQHRISWKLNIGALQHIVGKRGCVVGNTKIPLLDGRELSMVELLDEYGTDNEFWVYSCDKRGNVVPGKARNNGVTQKDAELVEVVLDNGETIRATPDHRFMKRDGGYVRADKLSPGDSLMPWYRRLSDGQSDKSKDRIVGYEEVYHPGLDQWEFTHRVVANSLCLKADGDSVVHHSNFNKSDNLPDNLTWMGYKDHIRLHACVNTPLSEATKSKLRAVDREKRVKAGKAAAAKGVLVENGKKAALACRGDLERGKKISNSLKKTLSEPKHRKQRSEAAKAQWNDPSIREKMCAALSMARSGKADTAPNSGSVPVVGENHKVVAVRRLVITEDVYDLSVDEHHNYATSSGVFVHNCWILQLGIWGPVIMGMVKELSEKIDPVFSELVTPPCCDRSGFKSCVYMEECRRRITGDDQLPPCPLHWAQHELNVRERNVLGKAEGVGEYEKKLAASNLPRNQETIERAKVYRGFWNRNPFTGELENQE